MTIAISPSEEWDYQLKADRADDGSIDRAKPVFRIGALTPEDEAIIEDLTVTQIAKAEQAQSTQINFGSVKLETLRRGLRGWSGFTDAEGKEAKFEKRGRFASDDSIGHIRLRDRAELVNAITERHKVTELEQD